MQRYHEAKVSTQRSKATRGPPREKKQRWLPQALICPLHTPRVTSTAARHHNRGSLPPRPHMRSTTHPRRLNFPPPFTPNTRSSQLIVPDSSCLLTFAFLRAFTRTFHFSSSTLHSQCTPGNGSPFKKTILPGQLAHTLAMGQLLHPLLFPTDISSITKLSIIPTRDLDGSSTLHLHSFTTTDKPRTGDQSYRQDCTDSTGEAPMPFSTLPGPLLISSPVQFSQPHVYLPTPPLRPHPQVSGGLGAVSHPQQSHNKSYEGGWQQGTHPAPRVTLVLQSHRPSSTHQR